MRRARRTIVGLAATCLVLVMALSAMTILPLHAGKSRGSAEMSNVAPPVRALVIHSQPPLPPPNFTVHMIGSPIINWSGNVTGALNNTTGRPWGETYDVRNRCLYVTENPATPNTQGYLTWLGPSTGYAPLSQQIPIGGGPAWNPQGIAWAPALYQPASWNAAFRGGILMIADTGSNSVSFYGIRLSTTNPSCTPTFLQTDTGVNWFTGVSLFGPWDVVYDLHTRLFYVTWSASSIVQAWSGSTPGCELSSNLSIPLGLSTDPAGRLEISNFQANGWVTQFPTVPGALGDVNPGACPGNTHAVVSNPGKELDRPVWTVYAPFLLGTNGTAGAKSIVAVSDSNYGIGGNLQGGCAPVGVPLTHVMAELRDGPLNCLNSVKLDAPSPPNPGAYGIAYNSHTHHVLEVLAAVGQVVGVNFNAVTGADVAAPGCAVSSLYCSVEVVWFSAPGATWYPGNTMAVTDWSVGTLYIAIGL